MKFATKTIHAGIEPDPLTGAVMTPIYQTSTYAQDGAGNHKGFEYARTQNPTRNVLQANLAALENGNFGICFGSGLAATSAIVHLLESGDEIIASDDLYGGTYRQFVRVYGKMGIKAHFVDMRNPQNIADKINPNTKLIWIETPTNPTLNVVDIAEICQLAQQHPQVKVCVDNTFASPYLQTPLDLGADIVLHSATKYLGGHSDVIHGAIVVKDKTLADALYFVQNAVGAVPAPQDCFLVLRGIKTLHLRVERACQNARKIAEFLQTHPAIDKIYYPGLPSHQGHEIAKKQMRDFGAMVSFSLKKDTFEAANQVLRGVHYFTCAESLGGVESLIGHPATMTHASIPREQRLKNGITDSFLRLSVGVEDADDLIEDLKKALDAVA
jgi:cystathionine gamma-lyase